MKIHRGGAKGMKGAGSFRRLLETRGPLILDGAMGTELQRRGVDIGLPLWSANALVAAPDIVLQIHRDYIAAGADIITTNTFRTTPRAFRNAGLPDRSAELTASAVHLCAGGPATTSGSHDAHCRIHRPAGGLLPSGSRAAGRRPGAGACRACPPARGGGGGSPSPRDHDQRA